MLAGQRVQRGRLAGMAAGRDHVVAACQQLADEFEAEAAVGAGDQAVSDGHAAGVGAYAGGCAFRPSVSACRCR